MAASARGMELSNWSDELRSLLRVPTPSRVEGKRVLVVDDAYSEGFTMREMARALLQAGAVEVAGLVLVRRKGA